MTNEGKLFEKYLHELLIWNAKFNLTSITDPAEIKRKHFDDSLLFLQPYRLSTESVVDIGAGAGFPGLPLKIACPGIKLTLVEARQKKVEFLKHLIKILDLSDVEVIWGRAEEAVKERRESFDFAVCRAVASLNTLCEYCLPFVKIGGHFVAYKEENISIEIEEAGNALKVLGGELVEVKRFSMRALVTIRKITPTPPQYPRRPGMAKKHPLR